MREWFGVLFLALAAGVAGSMTGWHEERAKAELEAQERLAVAANGAAAAQAGAGRRRVRFEGVPFRSESFIDFPECDDARAMSIRHDSDSGLLMVCEDHAWEPRASVVIELDDWR